MGVVILGGREAPTLPAAAYTTYRIAAPLRTHFRIGTCEEARCPSMMYGWVSPIDERTEQGQMWAYLIRKESGRKFTEEKQPDGLTVFTFAAGQKCFEQHRIRIERPEIFLREGGDWRGNPLGTARYRHTDPGLWVEDFANHQDRLATLHQRG
jgi:hypothetical protein